jgi:hypothetical protein
MKLVKQVTPNRQFILSSPRPCRRVLNFVCLAATLAVSPEPARSENLSSLAGTWDLVSAYEIRPEGTRTTNYGEHPKGLLMVDGAGHYSLQIFKLGRPVFASGA